MTERSDQDCKQEET